MFTAVVCVRVRTREGEREFVRVSRKTVSK